MKIFPDPAVLIRAWLLYSRQAFRGRHPMAAGFRVSRLAAGIVMAMATGMARAVPYSYETVPSIAVPDNNLTGVTRSISVLENFNIVDLNVGFTMTHNRRGDLRVRITSPQGTTVTLINGGTADTNNNYDILLDSASVNPINDTTADLVTSPFYDRRVVPDNALGLFNGENAIGVWTINVADITSGTSGTLNRLRLDFDGNSTALVVRVFDDLYWDGIWQNGSDPGISGVTVRAFDNAGASTVLTSNGDGTYSLALGVLTGTKIRYEVDPATLPSGYFEGLYQTGPGANASPLTGTVNTAAGLVTINAVAQKPKIACPAGADQDLFTTCFIGGPRTSRSPLTPWGGEGDPYIPADAPAVVVFPRAVFGTAPQTQNRYLADIERVGSTYGLAPQATKGLVYVGAFGKRHTDSGPGGNGAIYAVDTGGGGVIRTFTIPNAGTTAHGVDATNAANNGTTAGWIRDSNWYDRVGKESLGDLETNPTGSRLWTINLNDKRLYTVDVADPTSVAYGTVTDLGAITATADCVGGETNWRPFALCWNGSSLYLGGTCTGETSNNINDVSVLIYRLDSPTTNTTKTLIYNSRLSATDGGFKYNRGNAAIAWNPWRTTWDSTAFKSHAGFATIYPQPWLADFAFDNNKRLVLGIRDRFGDQIGIYTKNPGKGGTGDLTTDNNLYETVSMGEVLMAEWNPLSGATGVGTALAGDWRSEIAPGFSLPRLDDPNDALTANEFFSSTSYTDIHPETGQGGVAFNPLFPDQVTVLAQDPFSLRSGGVQVFSTLNGSSPYQSGASAGGYRIYQGQPTSGELGLFGKANGLGDLEYGCGTTTQQMGDIVWYDEDKDGVRDPAEVAISGVTVRQYADFNGDGVMDDTTGDGVADPMDTTTTDSNGRWVFGSRPNTAYRITFDLSTVAAFTDSSSNNVTIANLQPTRYQSAVTGANPSNDSNLLGTFTGRPMISLTTAAIGVSNHTLDAGFQNCLPLTVVSIPASLPTAVIGTAYSASLSTTGGLAPYTYAVSSGSLPAGLTLSSAGAITGTPTGPGTVSNFTVRVADSTACPGSASFSIGVNCNTLVLAPGSLAAGRAGIAYGPVTFSQTGGSGTINWTVSSGALPAGMSLEGGTGLLSGTPTAVGISSFGIRASDGNGCSGTVNLSLTVNSVAALGNLVFLDTNGDGSFNSGESGIDGVRVQLFASTGIEINVGADGIPGTADDAAGGMTTAGGGRYYFQGLAFGNYYVRISSASFASGQPLQGLLSATGAGTNDTTDDSLDENGIDNALPATNGIQSNTITLADNAEPIAEPGAATTQFDDNNSNLTLDFGFYAPASLGNQVFADVDNNGTFDGLDSGLDGITVILDRDSNADGDFLDEGETAFATLTTSGGGFYVFTGLVSASYQVRIPTPPAGYPVSSSSTSALDDRVDHDNNGIQSSGPGAAVNSPVIAIAAGENDLTVDFGFCQPAAISGTIFADLDNNDTGDVAINVVTVALCDALGNAVDNPNEAGIQDYVITTTNGTYAFTGLAPGSYLVKETQPSGYLTVTDQDSTSDFAGSPADPSNSSTTDNQIPALLAAGETDTGNDFIEEQPGAISGMVMEDINNDDAGDTGLSGVVLTLCVDLNGDGDDDDPGEGPADNPNEPGTQDYTVTTVGGSYSFTGLTPGSYVVKETQPGGLTTVNDNDSTDAGDDITAGTSADDRISVAIVANETDTGNDFVEENTSGMICGFVLADLDNNDSGDAAIPNVILTLQTAAGADVGNPAHGGAAPYSVAADKDGGYCFTQLPPGAWRIVETQPAGYLSVADVDGGDPDVIGNATLVTLAPGGTVLGQNFIEEQPAVISGTNDSDNNNDGLGDAVINVVTLTLCDSAGNPVDDPNQAGVQSYTITTTAGTYAFSGIAPGSYFVKQTQPAGYTTIADFDSTVDDPASPVDPANTSASDNRIPVRVAAGETDSGNDFLEKAPKPAGFSPWLTWTGLSGPDAAPLPDASGHGGNPDGDGFSNLLEYALCFPPQIGINPRCPYEIRITPGGRVDYAITRGNDLTDLTITLQVAGALGSPVIWTEAGGLSTTTTDHGDGTSTVVYQDLESLGAAFADGDGFVRARFGLDTDGDSLPDLFDSTEVAGWTDHAHPGDLRPGNPGVPDQCTTFSMPYLKCAVLTGTATGNGATTIDLTDSAGSSSVVGSLSPVRRYFVEVTGGSLEGHRFEVDVATSSATSLALKVVSRVNTGSLTVDALAGSRIVVRELWTYNELFPPETFKGGDSSSNSDSLLIHDGGNWSSYFLADLGGFKRWVLDGDFLLADQGQEILTPCEGLFVHRRGPSLTVARAGLVRANDFAKPLPGTGCVLVGSGYPVPQSYQSRVMTVAAGWRGDVDLAFSSQVLFWLGDTIPGKLCYSTDFLLNAGAAPLQFWTSADESSLPDKSAEPLFDGTGAAFYCLPAAFSDYVVPAQWFSVP